jgi:hypothetical protein
VLEDSCLVKAATAATANTAAATVPAVTAPTAAVVAAAAPAEPAAPVAVPPAVPPEAPPLAPVLLVPSPAVWAKTGETVKTVTKLKAMNLEIDMDPSVKKNLSYQKNLSSGCLEQQRVVFLQVLCSLPQSFQSGSTQAQIKENLCHVFGVASKGTPSGFSIHFFR